MRPEDLYGLPPATEPKTLSRREFVKVLGVAAAGSGLLTAALRGYLLTPNQRMETAEALVDKMGKLPVRHFGTRMGPMRITPIVICQDWAPELYAAGLAAGINYVHKAHQWRRLPDEFKNIPRESYYTDITVDSTPNNPDDEDAAYRQVTDRLERTGLKYFDIFKAHFGWKTVDDLKNKRGTYRAFQRLKREGKVRYFGVSQHPFRPYPEMIDALIADGRVDSIQPFYSYSSSKEDTAIFEKARKAGIGLMPMKVYNGGWRDLQKDAAHQKELKAEGMVGRACYRHVISLKGSDGQPIFHSCVSAIGNFTQFEENVGGFATRVASADGFVWV